MSFCLLLLFVLACSNPGTDMPDAVSDNTDIIQQPDNNYAGKIQNGEIAPDFTLNDINGNTVTLSELRGRKVVLNLWWIKCHGCTEEMPYLQEFYDKYSEQGVIMIAINQYEKESVVKAYIGGKNYTFTVIADSKKQLHGSYSNWGVPTTFFIDEEGVVRTRKDAGFINVEEIEDIYNSY
jgi:peroxiredoxin